MHAQRHVGCVVAQVKITEGADVPLLLAIAVVLGDFEQHKSAHCAYGAAAGAAGSGP